MIGLNIQHLSNIDIFDALKKIELNFLRTPMTPDAIYTFKAQIDTALNMAIQSGQLMQKPAVDFSVDTTLGVFSLKFTPNLHMILNKPRDY